MDSGDFAEVVGFKLERPVYEQIMRVLRVRVDALICSLVVSRLGDLLRPATLEMSERYRYESDEPRFRVQNAIVLHSK